MALVMLLWLTVLWSVRCPLTVSLILRLVATWCITGVILVGFRVKRVGRRNWVVRWYLLMRRCWVVCRLIFIRKVLKRRVILAMRVTMTLASGRVRLVRWGRTRVILVASVRVRNIVAGLSVRVFLKQRVL